MKDIRNTNIRFNLDDPLHKKAWVYLHTMDRKAFKSYSSAVIAALVDFFDRYNKKKDDPYFETRESEERFVDRIVEEVGKNIKIYFSGLTINGSIETSKQKIIEDMQEEIEENADIDWSFIGKG